MSRKIAVLLAALMLLGPIASGETYRISDENELNFGRLLICLLRAYEKPSTGDREAIDSVLDAIGAMSASDREVAGDIAEHWLRVYVEGDAYPMYIYDGGDRATALEASGIPDTPTHAFIVLGYTLKDGGISDELKGRCDAAGAAATSFPQSLLILSGGATGRNNPDKHTEAGVMRDYLAERWGIAPGRMLVDERALSTAENAENSFALMRDAGVTTYTIVTSTYHQKWGQVDYNCMAAFYRQAYGYDPTLLANYSFDIAPSETFKNDARWAIRHLCALLGLPDAVIEAMKRAY